MEFTYSRGRETAVFFIFFVNKQTNLRKLTFSRELLTFVIIFSRDQLYDWDYIGGEGLVGNESRGFYGHCPIAGNYLGKMRSFRKPKTIWYLHPCWLATFCFRTLPFRASCTTPAQGPEGCTDKIWTAFTFKGQVRYHKLSRIWQINPFVYAGYCDVLWAAMHPAS